MAKSLIITEKPSVAREFATILHVSGRQDGYIENDSYVITWCVGHLVEMVYPEVYDEKYKKWRLEDLPFLPEVYKYDVIESVRKQYEIVHKMLFREDIDTVYWAGDAGKEGQTIEENIRNFGGVREGMKELRVWIDSQTEEEILRGLKEAKPMSDYANLGKSGIMRTIEDYAMGINFSRALSVKYGSLLNDAAGTKNYTAIAVGRVMTCVLGMVVIREREIRNFIETPFYRVVGKFTDAGVEAEWKAQEGSKYFESPLLYKENGFKKKESADALITELSGKRALVKNIEKGITKKRAPLLFNLAELQAECAKRFKISPDETLQVAQELYEKKLTTYPRTDARVLSTAVAKEINKNVSRLKGYAPVANYVEHIMKEGLYRNIGKSMYTDDSKITDHYAIIPTGQLTELNNLTGLQRDVFDLIVRRFLSIFYPAAEYSTVKLTAMIDRESFFASAKELKSPGFLEVAGKIQEDDSDEKEDKEDKESPSLMKIAESLSNGMEIPVTGFELKEGKTNPPKRYTSGSMVLAMENAGQLIEDEELRAQIKGSGIGTSATRAEIIKKLIRVGYLNLNKKTQILTPEMLGEMIYEIVDMTVPDLLNPKMTASWEKGLDGITRGTVDMGEYRKKLEDYIRKETLSMVDKNLKSELITRIQPLTGKESRGIATIKKMGIACPLCGGELQTTPFGYGCSNYRETKCRFSIGTIAGRDLSEEEFKKLLNDGETDVLDGFVSKTKKKFSAALVLKKNEEGQLNLEFDFSKVQPEVVEGLLCPSCGGKIEMTHFGYRCQNNHQGVDSASQKDAGINCNFSIGTIAGKKLSVAEVTQLIQEGKTDVLNGFTSKTKKKFSAALVLKKNEEGQLNLEFDFSQNEAKLVEGVVCPDCGGNIEVLTFGYACVNRHANPGEEAGNCQFVIGKIASKDLTQDNVKELLTEGRTSTIRGFKSKAGKKFDACLILEKDENGKSTVKFDFENVEAKKVKDAKCPACGGDVVVSKYGYACSNHDWTNPESCKFRIGKIADKDLNETQVRELLVDGRTSTIRGFKSKAGKKFDACLALTKEEDGTFKISFDFENVEAKRVKDVKCPICGDEIVFTPFGFACAKNDKDNPESCRFVVSSVASVKIKEATLKELLQNGKTGIIEGFVAKTGMKFDAALKLDENKQVVFDFPEKPKPVETTVACPKCNKMLMKSQHRYECECGFKVFHTVAKVELSEDIIKELFETGKTKNKVKGFISKAGNQFDTCLKYENETISFDFDNPGEDTSLGESVENIFDGSDAELAKYLEDMAKNQPIEDENGSSETEFYGELEDDSLPWS